MTFSEEHSEDIASHNSLNFDTSPFKQPTFWSHEETKLLITLRQERDSLFISMKRPRKLWAEIAAILQKRGFDKTSEQCHQKWKNMLRSFREVEEYNSRAGPTEKKKCSFYDEISDYYAKTCIDSPKPFEADERVTPESQSKMDLSDPSPRSLSEVRNNAQSVHIFNTVPSPTGTSNGPTISITNSSNRSKSINNNTTRTKRSLDSALAPLHSKLLRIQREGFDSSIPPERLLDEFHYFAQQRNLLNSPYDSPVSYKSNQRPHVSNRLGVGKDLGEAEMKENMERFINFYREQSLCMNTGAEKARENFRHTLEVIEHLAKDFAEKEHQYADRQARMFENFVEALRKD